MYESCELEMPLDTNFFGKKSVFSAIHIISINKKDPVYRY